MQDRYAGDIGDFSKLGLLRALAGTGAHTQPWTLGMLWWRVPDERHNADGRHVQYLDSPSKAWADLRECDDELAVGLRRVVQGERTVRALQELAVLPPETRYFDEALDLRGVQQAARADHRAAWLRRGLETIGDAELVCVDPDNGLEIPSCSLLANKGPKFIGYDELRTIAGQRRSVVVYQHVDRSGPLADQIAKRRGALVARLGLADPPLAVVFRRASARVYFVVAQPQHADVLGARVRELCGGPWARHFELR